MSFKCRYCGQDISKKALKIHQRNCRRKKKPLKKYVQGIEFEQEFAENLQEFSGKDQSEIQQELSSVINRAINKDPEKFKKALKDKGYD